jgi:hypothetical protein
MAGLYEALEQRAIVLRGPGMRGEYRGRELLLVADHDALLAASTQCNQYRRLDAL